MNTPLHFFFTHDNNYFLFDSIWQQLYKPLNFETYKFILQKLGKINYKTSAIVSSRTECRLPYMSLIIDDDDALVPHSLWTTTTKQMYLHILLVTKLTKILKHKISLAIGSKL
jgi:hypothetical protein